MINVTKTFSLLSKLCSPGIVCPTWDHMHALNHKAIFFKTQLKIFFFAGFSAPDPELHTRKIKKK